MDTTYPAGPTAVPADLTKPTPAYRRHAWLAMAGLALFVVLYAVLAGWFAWTAYHLLFRVGLSGAGGLWTILAGGSSAFLAVFMLKALLFVKQGHASEDVEITAQEQPRLFAFLHRLADEAGAPRPHRVYLSNRVNAAVFYDLSVANLIIPSRKNLEIGLALVNALSLGELKAVLAHEFGHFAQRTMYVGRWVYIGQQIAAQIIAKRDALDGFLQALSRVDLRIAWIGWTLSLIVWSIRSVMELVFRMVIIAQRALSREMEFQADLVAVALTGSDALVHALHRLNVADDAWSRAASFAISENAHGRRVRDVFAVQTRVLEQLARVLGQPDLGRVPPLPEEKREAHRLFRAQLAQPPRMWLTHPLSSEREENCKRRYVRADIDARSAWELFDNVQALKEQLSEHLVRVSGGEKSGKPAELADSMKKLDEQFERAYLNRSYRGRYLGRSLARHFASPNDLYGDLPDLERLSAALDALYPESLTEDLERLRDLEEEQATLKALESGALTTPDGIIRHRGKQVERSDLHNAIAEVGSEIAGVLGRVLEHDRACRTAHLAAANSLGGGWGEYLQGLVQVLHYAEHAEANLLDAHGYFGSVVAIVTADRKVSHSEVEDVVTAGGAVHSALSEIFQQREAVQLDRTLTARLEVEDWTKQLETLNLPEPTAQNIGNWMKVIDGWVGSYESALSSLRLAALEQLLLAESQVAKFVRDGMQPREAPPPSQVPRKYSIRTPGMERPRQTELNWWDRFQMADGTLATVARLVSAAVIVGAVVYVGSTVGRHLIAIYNGLDTPVNVTFDAERVRLAPYTSAHLYVSEKKSYHIDTQGADSREIEAFDATPEEDARAYVYNVAGAAPLVQWTVYYGNDNTAPNYRILGNARWSGAWADDLFEEPPRTVSSRSAQQRDVLQAYGTDAPYAMLAALNSDEARKSVIRAHALWDRSGSPHLPYWLSVASERDGYQDILAARLRVDPMDIAALRAEQDLATGDARRTVCERQQALARSKPDSADLQYIAVRCIQSGAEQDAAFLELNGKWPQNGWVSVGASYVYVKREEWEDALLEMQQANRYPATSMLVSLPLARLYRVTESVDRVGLENLARESGIVRRMLTLESGEGLSGVDLVYRDLARGDLDSAVQTARSEPDTYARVLRLAAASDGASPALVREALALAPENGVDVFTVWYAIALAMREHGDAAPYVAAAHKLAPHDAAAVLRFLDDLRAGGPARFQIPTIEMRAAAYGMACVLRGPAAPPKWRWVASRLLFAQERPYFRDVRRPPPKNTTTTVEPAPGVTKGKRTPPRLIGF
jgi:Zn-dependent protease with chaperone function